MKAEIGATRPHLAGGRGTLSADRWILPARLAAVLELVPTDGAVADIGSGHGALALGLVARGQRVVATERTETTFALLTAEIARRGAVFGPGLGHSLQARRGEGLAPIADGEVGTAVIAGMGARTVVRILESAAWLPPCLVLQPAQDPDLLREWIGARGWHASVVEARQGRRTYQTWRVEVPV